MSIDAGTIYAAVRLKLDNLDADVNKAIGGMDRMSKSINDTGKNIENLSKLGQNLTLKMTLPIVAAAGAMVKLASDTGESLNAANVVFKESAKTIEAWGDTAAKQAGLSKAEFYQSSAVIGAGLQNAGLSAKEAADQTINLTKRAADMASIFNTDVKDAMGALQSALRGESEPIRRYAISLSETTVAAKALALGLVKPGEEMSNFAKTQARMAIIMEQSNRFAGDFVNTSDQLANSTRIMVAEVKNQAAEMGKELLPVILEVVKAGRMLIANLSGMSEEQRKTILMIAAIAAGTGPLILGITNTIKAVNTLKVAFVAMSTSGGAVTAVIAGIAAVTLALVAYNEAQIKAANQKKDALDKLFAFDSAKSEAENLEQVAYAQDLVTEAKAKAFMGAKFAETAAQYEKKLKMLKEDIEYQKLVVKGEEVAARIGNEKATKEAKDAAARLAADNLYIDGRKAIVEILKGEKTEYENLQKQIDELTKLKWADKKLDSERIAAINILIGKQNEIKNATTTANDDIRKSELERLGGLQETINSVYSLDGAQKTTAQSARDALIEEIRSSTLINEQKDELIAKTNEYYESLGDKEASIKFANNMVEAISLTSQGMTALFDLINAVNKRNLEDSKETLNERYEVELETLEKTQEAETKILDERLAKDKAINDAEVENLKKAVADRQAIEKAALDEKQKQELDFLDTMLQAELFTRGLVTAETVEQYALELQAAIETGDAEKIKKAQDAYDKIVIEQAYADQRKIIEDQAAADDKALEDKRYLETKALTEKIAADNKVLAEKQAAEKNKLEETQNAKKLKLEEERNKKLLQMEYEANLASWNMQLAMSIAMAAQLAMNMYASAAAVPILGVPGGPIAAGIGAAFGALQIGSVMAAKPKPPKFETGGIVPGRSFTGDQVPILANSGERILTAKQNAVYESMMMNGGTTNNTSSLNIGTFIGDKAGLRELERKLAGVRGIEKIRRGTK